MKDWSDAEIYRAITSGVGKDNNALFPIMPYNAYGNLDDEDIFSIIAYLRTLAPIKNDVSAAKSDFPMNFIINTMPKEAHPIKRPSPTNQLAYGEYLTRAADCIDCHTPMTAKGELIMDKAYAGGRKFPLRNGKTVTSTNITFDENTGLGKIDKATFISIFKGYDMAINPPASIAATVHLAQSSHRQPSHSADQGAV